ncbi:hypothetical protein WQ57_12205 [Mesobacillus campisalis]|uniref:Uncharacterized protein n=1 Tax=Mesobacillus campisalis TaxID=1408103 RepID=A0A0M2SU96_9BACI|nr:hypothetical protein [Mesobacillus campisalis]KKK37718.1 hypothetical protein WQ57_12205 [Mesobacillus campisalis]
MYLFISMKKAGKRKNEITRQRIQLPSRPNTLRALLTEVICQNVKQLNDKETEQPLISYLPPMEIADQSASGKVGFGSIYNSRKADEKEAVQTGIQAFEDGLFIAFLNDIEIKELDSPLAISEGDELVFIRLTMLAGRMW